MNSANEFKVLFLIGLNLQKKINFQLCVVMLSKTQVNNFHLFIYIKLTNKTFQIC